MSKKELSSENTSYVLVEQYRKIAAGRSFEAMRKAMGDANLPIGNGTLQRLAAGDTGVRVDSIKKLARFGKVEPEDLIGGPLRDLGDFIEVRRAGVTFANGHGSVYVHDDDKPPLSFRADFLRKLGIAPGKAVVVEADGISNEPKIIDGSVVLVNMGDRDRLDNDFFAFRADGELLIKRLEPLEGIGWLATAENPNFKPKSKVYREGVDDFEVIGRAVWTGSLL